METGGRGWMAARGGLFLRSSSQSGLKYQRYPLLVSSYLPSSPPYTFKHGLSSSGNAVPKLSSEIRSYLRQILKRSLTI
ncbi:unnamed protein product [Nezara viridula]|uniref:Uncharacterized protein n=1 Tax=Nezara viridula TaxID=85310 RepID=A0A9P0E3W4_NEZVI|nr:unnamed protein product [Nezara viridula]